MSEHKIYLIGGEDDDACAILKAEQKNDDCYLQLELGALKSEATAMDFFEAFCEIRIQLEKSSLIPFCYGASLNVYPSGMCRDMGSGLMAYKTEIGQPASRENLVKIFDQGTDVIPSYVAIQKERYEKWIESLNA